MHTADFLLLRLQASMRTNASPVTIGEEEMAARRASSK
jgi:hypothetical protein